MSDKSIVCVNNHNIKALYSLYGQSVSSETTKFLPNSAKLKIQLKV